jgi:hypothetical protein
MTELTLPSVVCTALVVLKPLCYSGQHTLEPCLDVLRQLACDGDRMHVSARGRNLAVLSWKDDLLQLSCLFVELNMEVMLRQITPEYVECKVSGEVRGAADAHHLYAWIFLETVVNFCGGGKRPVLEVVCAPGPTQRLFVKLKKDAMLWVNSVVATAAASPVCGLACWLRGKKLSADQAKAFTDMFCALVNDPTPVHWQKAIRCTPGWTPALLAAQMELWDAHLSAL